MYSLIAWFNAEENIKLCETKDLENGSQKSISLDETNG